VAVWEDWHGHFAPGASSTMGARIFFTSPSFAERTDSLPRLAVVSNHSLNVHTSPNPDQLNGAVEGLR